MPYIEKITLYPIKSLNGIDVQQAQITECGALKWDRSFALYNQAGRTVNAKKYPDILKIRAQFDLESLKVKLSAEQGQSTTFQLTNEQGRIAQFFSDYFGEHIHMKENITSGFPDDDQNSGPTIVSTATYREVQKWFPSLTLESLRKRFRANIELGRCEEAFWEDRLFGKPGVDHPFQIGSVLFIGKKPCARCTVPTRDPISGKANKNFMKDFIAQREKTFPAFAHAGQFKHYFHLCVNTIIPAPVHGALLKVRGEVKTTQA